MADTETKETKVAGTPEKKVVADEKEEVVAKETPKKETPKKEVKEVKEVKEAEAKEAEVVDEDSKASENGNGNEATENGTSDEKETDEKDAVESTNGDSTDVPTDTCSIKRKSTTTVDVTDEASKDATSPVKKAKLEEKTAVEAETNGDA